MEKGNTRATVAKVFKLLASQEDIRIFQNGEIYCNTGSAYCRTVTPYEGNWQLSEEGTDRWLEFVSTGQKDRLEELLNSKGWDLREFYYAMYFNKNKLRRKVQYTFFTKEEHLSAVEEVKHHGMTPAQILAMLRNRNK